MVVNIAQRDFNTDMESYISDRKKDYEAPKARPKPATKEPVVNQELEAQEEFTEEEDEYFKKESSLIQKVLGFISGEPSNADYDETDEGMEEEKDTKETKPEKKIEKTEKRTFHFLKRLFASESDIEEEYTNEAPTINAELKEVLKIQNKWLQKLPQSTIKEFKNSEDYKIYKETLKKHNLIK